MDQTTNFSQINYNIFQQNMAANPNLFNMNNFPVNKTTNILKR